MKNTKEKLLVNISRRAKKIQFGKSIGQIRYPANFRSLVLKALNAGASISDIAESASIKSWTVHRWCKEAAPVVRKLKVVQRMYTDDDKHSSCAKVRLGEHVTIEVPSSMLSGEFLAALSRL